MTLLDLRRAAHASPVAIALLIVANAVPLLGVLLLGWDLITLLALYWLENGVVGVFAFLRIATAEGVDPNPGSASVNGRPIPVAQLRDPRLARAIYLPFFVMHYGIFWLVHGIFVLLALPEVFTSVSGQEVAGVSPTAIAWALPFLVLSHGVSFWLNWLRGGERLTSTPAEQMSAPYGRVITLHVTIVVGAILVAMLGAPIWALVVMVVVKTLADLSAHLAERRGADARAQANGVTLTGGGWSIQR